MSDLPSVQDFIARENERRGRGEDDTDAPDGADDSAPHEDLFAEFGPDAGGQS